MSIDPKNVCVLYHYFDGGVIARKNLNFFLEFGSKTKADIFISIVEKSEPPKESSISKGIEFIPVPNHNFDFGGISRLVNSEIDVKKYDAFIIINSTARGPFLPNYFQDDWTTVFTRMMSPKIGIVATTINCLERNNELAKSYHLKYGGNENLNHAQTMAFALSKSAMEVLINNGFWAEQDQKSKIEIIRDYELHLSQVVLKNQMAIRCLLPEYDDIDFEFIDNPTSENGDANYPYSYFGRTINPLETVFIKTNREMYSEAYLEMLANSRRGWQENDDGLKLYISQLKKDNAINRTFVMSRIALTRLAKKKPFFQIILQLLQIRSSVSKRWGKHSQTHKAH